MIFRKFKPGKRILTILLLMLTVLSGCGPALKLPDSAVLEASKIYDINGKLITTITRHNRDPIAINNIPLNLQNATVAIEDGKFYQHHGFNFAGIGRAAIRNIEARKIVEGGSTITQQLAKNLYLSQERTFTRKIKEIYLTTQLERKYTKKEILEAYLNSIYYGQGAYGIGVASETYFGKPANELNLAESSLLAGIPGLPSKFNPFTDFKASKERQALVLDRMAKLGMITQTQAEEAKKTRLTLKTGEISAGKAPYFTQEVINYITSKYENGNDLLYKSSLSIYTTLDLDTQAAAENAFNQGIKNSDPDLQGALVALDPKTGYVKAYIGGRNFSMNKFNRVNARRQPGSAFKPFVYTAAIDKGDTEATTLECEPVEFPQPDGSIYAPTDFEAEKYHYRPFTLKEAITISDNVISVKLNYALGPQAGADYAKKMGIKSPLRSYLSLVLGTSEVTPLEMANAYGTLANQGIKTEPVMVTKIVDSNGKTLEENKPKTQRAINPQVAYIVTDMLKNVLTGEGTGSLAGQILNRPAAGKTGTTQNFMDAWFVGYTPNLVASVYLGFDNPSRTVGKTGGAVSAPIWANFMKDALKGTPPKDFNRPPNIVSAKICPESGLLAPVGHDYIDMVFIEGTEPTEYCTDGYNYPANSKKTQPKKKKNFFDWLFR